MTADIYIHQLPLCVFWCWNDIPWLNAHSAWNFHLLYLQSTTKALGADLSTDSWWVWKVDLWLNPRVQLYMCLFLLIHIQLYLTVIYRETHWSLSTSHFDFRLVDNGCICGWYCFDLCSFFFLASWCFMTLWCHWCHYGEYLFLRTNSIEAWHVLINYDREYLTESNGMKLRALLHQRGGIKYLVLCWVHQQHWHKWNVGLC